MKLITPLLFATVAAGCADRSDQEPRASRQVEIGGLDYAFQAPKELPAGRTVFRFLNKGKVRHEFNIFLLKPGVAIDRVLAAQRAGETVKSLIDGPVGVLFAQPGEKPASGIASDLLPGREYGVICIFQDSATAPRHYDMGMYSVIKVARSPVRLASPPSAVDTVIGIDYAFRYPRTVTPGKHTFVFRNEGKVRHEFSVSLLKKGVTLEKVREVEKANGNVDALFEQDLGLLNSRAGETSLGQLEIDMLPGREYVIVCFFQDTEKSKPHYELGMFGTIRVSDKTAP